MSEQEDNSRTAIRLGVIAGLGALVRFAGLEYHELWLDEILRVLWAIEPGTNLWEQATVGHAGSVFTTLWSGWVWHATHSFAALRALQALCSLACIPLAFVLGRRFFSENASLALAALVALSPMHVAIARQAEEYAFLVLFALVATLLLARLFEAKHVTPRDSVMLGIVSAAGFLSGGYMVLPYFLSLALSSVWLLRRELKARDVVLLAAGQLPMVALFFYSLTFWAIEPREAVTQYLAFMRAWVQFGSPRLPSNILADLFFYGQLWAWGKHVGPWAMGLEFVVALALVWICTRGHRALAARGNLGSLPGLAVLLLFGINAAIFLKYSGIPFYFSRVYAGGTFFLFILFIAGLQSSLREARQFVLVLFVPVMLASTLALKLEIHPARPLWFRNAIHRIDALTERRQIWVHPGELADLLRLETRGADLEFVGVWKNSFATADATVTLDQAMPDEEFAAAAAQIAQSGGCLLVVDYFVEKRDPQRRLEAALKEDFPYERASGAGNIPLYCSKK